MTSLPEKLAQLKRYNCLKFIYAIIIVYCDRNFMMWCILSSVIKRIYHVQQRYIYLWEIWNYYVLLYIKMWKFCCATIFKSSTNNCIHSSYNWLSQEAIIKTISQLNMKFLEKVSTYSFKIIFQKKLIRRQDETNKLFIELFFSFHEEIT